MKVNLLSREISDNSMTTYIFVVYSIVAHKRPNKMAMVEEYAPNTTYDPSNVADPPRPISSTTQVSEVQELLASASDTTTSLFKLSIFVRHATPRDRYAKAAGTLPAFEEMLELDTSHVASKFPRIGRNPEMNWLQKRLGRAITLRRQYLNYSANHRKATGVFQYQDATHGDYRGR